METLSKEKITHDQTHPEHYSQFSIEPLEFIVRNNLDFLQGNIIKYVCRFKMKGGLEDLNKAMRYLQELIKITMNGGNI